MAEYNSQNIHSEVFFFWITGESSQATHILFSLLLKESEGVPVNEKILKGAVSVGSTDLMYPVEVGGVLAGSRE